MLSFYSDYLDRVQDLHNDIKKCIAGLTVEALDWKPQPEMNSFTVLVDHVVYAERYLVGDMTGQESANQSIETAFTISGLDEATLVQKLDDVLAYTEKVLDKFTLDDLDKKIVSATSGNSFTISRSLLHSLEHTASHMGHMQVMRDIWDNRQ
jgi:hypothetical protein